MTPNVTRDAIDDETVRPAAKLLLAAGSLVVVLYLLTLLPGVDRLVPGAPVSFAAVVTAIATAAIVWLLWLVAPRLASLTRIAVDGPARIVENLASLVYWLVVLAAVLIAHAGFTGVGVPLLAGTEWLYDGLFLLAALPPVALIAARLYALLDPSAELIADRVSGEKTEDD